MNQEQIEIFIKEEFNKHIKQNQDNAYMEYLYRTQIENIEIEVIDGNVFYENRKVGTCKIENDKFIFEPSAKLEYIQMEVKLKL